MRQTLWYRRLGHSGISFVNIVDNFRINFILLHAIHRTITLRDQQTSHSIVSELRPIPPTSQQIYR